MSSTGSSSSSSCSRRKSAEAESAKAIAEERAAASEAAIADLERRLAEERQRLRQRLTGLYRMGRHGYIRMPLSLAPGEALLPAVRALRFLARRDAATVASFEEIAARLAVENRELEAEREVARGWFARENDRRNQLVALERRKAQMLAGTRRESEQITSAALELGERARKLSALLDALYGRSDPGLGGLPIGDFRGLLDWPVEGRVSAEFGPRVDPRYGTRVPHNGLDLETVPGSEVRAVYPGKVLFAAPFEGLGPMVVVQHAGRVFTLYAGPWRAAGAQGDVRYPCVRSSAAPATRSTSRSASTTPRRIRESGCASGAAEQRPPRRRCIRTRRRIRCPR